MTLILQGTDNSVSSPAAQGGTAGTTTGVYYPATNQIALATNGTQAMLANASQGVQFANAIGVGATTPTTSGAGVTFPATQSASSNANTLDDYEEGEVTLGFAFGGGTTGITYDSANGCCYTKVGRVVTITGIIYTTNKGSSTGGLSITGLPFPIRSGNPGYSGAVLYYEGITIPSGYNFIVARTNPSQTTINLYLYQSNGNYIEVTDSQCANQTQVRITYSYTTS